MNSKEIRKAFLDFFNSKQHKIVPSAPMVIKNDPTLMFTNAGMNQFKDIFLGNAPIKDSRVSNAQKCLRVSGKHNDLEEVGHDTYHHTMFEMLGNWSFGDYFKADAINWAWEFLVDVLNLPQDRLYVTVFEGSKDDNLELDKEAQSLWTKHLPLERVLNGSKKDNFWEMGDSGPCGPCSEIHIDLRNDEERAKIDGKELVNQDHPQVVEVWNLVFVQYNRKANGSLEPLPHKHVDTGMGFERLCMAMQKKQSNYDTDVFQPLIQTIAKMSDKKYGDLNEADIAMRVIADHLRTISFAITDGQLPSNNKAGYVIRRILRRAVRYGYTFLNLSEPFINKLVPVLIDTMGEAYPELVSQQDIITKVIREEEVSFLRTLETGIKLLDQIIDKTKAENYKVIKGKVAFELYDTFGFPLDLTELILKENDLIINRREFDEEMEKQKSRSRNAASVDTDDWIELRNDEVEEFIGYDHTESNIYITRYRKVKTKETELFQLVFNYTPFYAESGGQVGDSGYIEADGDKVAIIDTKKENNLTIHIAESLPADTTVKFKAVVDQTKRTLTENNHTATHLLHETLREILGSHVEQKGSLVTPDYLRFDFSHFQKMTEEELVKVEAIVNAKIRQNHSLEENRAIPMDEAQNMGATALFGEKYGDLVRTIKFGDSIELCGGTHASATGQIGLFKIISEGAIAAGVRRIEAVSSVKAEKFVNQQLNDLKEVKQLLKSPKDVIKSVGSLLKENETLTKQIAAFEKDMLKNVKGDLVKKAENINGINVLTEQIDVNNAGALKDLAFQIKDELDNIFLVLGANIDGKANLAVMISDNLVKENGLNAGAIIRNIAKEVQGGGGGQSFFATAGGKNPDGIPNALAKAKEIIEKL